jgi:hypothetical protein
MGLGFYHSFGNALAARDFEEQDRALHLVFTAMYSSKPWLTKSDQPPPFTWDQAAATLFRLYYIEHWSPARTYFFLITGMFLPLGEDNVTIELPPLFHDTLATVLSTETILLMCHSHNTMLNMLQCYEDDDDDEDDESWTDADDEVE